MSLFIQNRLTEMERSECILCHRKRNEFSCASCTSSMLQQRRTMLAALQADVAVLRKKTESALNMKNPLFRAELRLNDCIEQVRRVAETVMKTREKLCTERIAVLERTSMLEKRSLVMVEVQHKLQNDCQQAKSLHAPVLECLDYQIQWANENAAKVRGDRLRELFALFALIPEKVISEEADEKVADPFSRLPDVRRQRKLKKDVPVFYRTIAGLPLPKSGKFENVPPEVVAAAFGKVIHLLNCLVKYLKITYPHPMIFNGSFSTIGNTTEGAGCHTLYPDGSIGFGRGVSMLHENVEFLCASQGVPLENIHSTDLLGNLLQIYKSSRLGTICNNQETL